MDTYRLSFKKMKEFVMSTWIQIVFISELIQQYFRATFLKTLATALKVKVTSNKWKWRDWQNLPKFDECELNRSNHFHCVCNHSNIYVRFHFSLFCVCLWIQIAFIGEFWPQVLFWEGFKFRSDYEIEKIKMTEFNENWWKLNYFWRTLKFHRFETSPLPCDSCLKTLISWGDIRE